MKTSLFALGLLPFAAALAMGCADGEDATEPKGPTSNTAEATAKEVSKGGKDGARDGKTTTTPRADCIASTCESVQNACGDHDDGCGKTFNCGACATDKPACTPKTCAQLKETCGVHADGCGGSVSCGECKTACATDGFEPNNKPETASDLGEANDWDGATLQQLQLEMSDGDEDWFSVAVKDSGFNGNPAITATTTDKKLEVSAFHRCNSLPDYSYCDASSNEGVQDNLIGRGCRALGTVTLNTDCSGINESGKTYIRVRKTVSDAACRSYDLTVTVK